MTDNVIVSRSSCRGTCDITETSQRYYGVMIRTLRSVTHTHTRMSLSDLNMNTSIYLKLLHVEPTEPHFEVREKTQDDGAALFLAQKSPKEILLQLSN